MLRNIIHGQSTVEIYKANVDLVKGMVVTKDYTNQYAVKASASGVEIFFADKDYQPTGALSDVEISDYTTEAQAIAANDMFVMRQPVSGIWATDQVVPTGFVAGDYAIAGTGGNTGLLVKAVGGNTSKYRYVGTYDDAGHTLYMFEVLAATVTL